MASYLITQEFQLLRHINMCAFASKKKKTGCLVISSPYESFDVRTQEVGLTVVYARATYLQRYLLRYLITQEFHLLWNIDGFVCTQGTVIYVTMVTPTYLITQEFHLLWNIENVHVCT